jgi:hypothetical protein
MCSNMQESVADYLLGALDESRRRTVEEHLKDCPDCRAYMQALQEQEQALVTLGERISAGMAERQERVIEAAVRASPHSLRIRFAKWAMAAALILGSGIVIGRLTASQPVDAERLKAEIRQAVLADMDRRVNSALAKAADQTTDGLQVMAAQLASGSKAMMETRLAELIQLIETARRTDRQRVADALVQIEMSRLDDRNQIAASLRSLATPATELSTPSQKAPTTTNN